MAARGRRDGREFGANAGFVRCVVITNDTLVERETVNVDAGVVVLLVLVQQPGFSAIGVALQKNKGLDQVQVGYLQALSQQLRQVDGKRHLISRQHVGLCCPGRVGKSELPGVHARPGPAQRHIEVAFDQQCPSGLLEHFLFKWRAQPVPAKQGEKQDSRDDQGQHHTGRPFERTQQDRGRGLQRKTL